MRSLLVLPILALPLAGCQTIGSPSDQFATICRNAPLVDLAFDVAVSGGRIKASVIKAEKQAMAVIYTVCANPPKDAATAIATVSRAYQAMLNAKRAVENAS